MSPRQLTVIVPVLNEAATVATVVAYALRAAHVGEVIVVDDGSLDETADRARAAGARVVTSTLLGKGASMEDGVREAKHQIVVFLDGDLSHLEEGVIERLTDPIRADQADFVKASFTRPGGRVTTLAARPLLQTFFPEISFIEQPLGGLVAARRSLLGRLRFETDYGADIGILLDAAALGARIAQVPIGRIVHDSQPLQALADMAKQVVRAILVRAGRRGRLRTGQVREIEEVERSAQTELSLTCAHIGSAQRLALLPIDGVLLAGSFLSYLAKRTRREAAYAEVTARRLGTPAERISVTAAVFKGVGKAAFIDAAREVPLRPGATETVIALRRAGYRVGVVSGGSRLVADVVRRRVFADFCVGNLLRFHRLRATGDLQLAPAMLHPNGCRSHDACTGNVVRHLRERLGVARRHVLAVGHAEEHLCLLREAGLRIAFHPAQISALRDLAPKSCTEGALSRILDMPGVLPSTTRRSGGRAKVDRRSDES